MTLPCCVMVVFISPVTLSLTIAVKKHQFVTRSESGPKYWVFNTRSQRMNVGFFNRYHKSMRQRKHTVDGLSWLSPQPASTRH